jgi:hypothetical protein
MEIGRLMNKIRRTDAQIIAASRKVETSPTVENVSPDFRATHDLCLEAQSSGMEVREADRPLFANSRAVKDPDRVQISSCRTPIQSFPSLHDFSATKLSVCAILAMPTNPVSY